MNINFKKIKIRLFLAIIFFIGFSIFLSSCKKDEIVHPHPCLNENCEAYYEIDPQVSPDVYEDVNSYRISNTEVFNTLLSWVNYLN